MASIPKQRDIIDRKTLMASLEGVVQSGGEVDRRQVLGVLKQSMAAGTAEVRRRFEDDGATGMQTVHAQSFLIDQLIRILFDFIEECVFPTSKKSSGDAISVVATGGYGRGELAPKSDLDLLFVLPYKQTPRGEQLVEHIL